MYLRTLSLLVLLTARLHAIPIGAEDFAYYSQVIPASFYRLGTRNELKGITSYVHTPTFDIDEDALRISSGLMAWMALRELGN